MSDQKQIYDRCLPMAQWGPECARGLRIADSGTEIQGQKSVRKISMGRKQRGMASDGYKRLEYENRLKT